MRNPELALLQEEERFGEDGVGIEVAFGLTLLGFLVFGAGIAYSALSTLQLFS